MRRGRALGVLGDAHCRCPACTICGGRVSLLGSCFSSWGVPWISTLSLGPEWRGSRPPRTIPTLFLSAVFLEIKAPGNSPHVGAGNSSDPASSPLGDPVSPPSQAPAPHSPAGTVESLVCREPPGPPLTNDPSPGHPILLGCRRERRANSPGWSGTRGHGGAATL